MTILLLQSEGIPFSVVLWNSILPELYLVKDISALGQYKNEYKQALGMLKQKVYYYSAFVEQGYSIGQIIEKCLIESVRFNTLVDDLMTRVKDNSSF